MAWRIGDTYREAHVCSLLSLLLAHFSHLLTQTLFEFLISEKKACEWKSADLQVTF